MKLWQIIALVAAGVLYGVAEPGRLTFAFGHATLYVLLPALLFEAAWSLSWRAMVRQWRAILVLSVPGVAITALIIAGALSIARVSFPSALLTGAILSATDPIAVVAIFRRLPVPLMLSTIVECEALFNDAVAVVLYRAVLAFALAGAIGGAGLASIAGVAVAGSLGGIAIGVAVAFVIAWMLQNRSQEWLQIAATLVCAYGTYFLASSLQCSGIFATIASGIALRYFERRWVTLTVAEEVNRVWDVIALVANVVVFFLVGAALDVSVVREAPVFIIASLAGVAVARGALSVLLVPGGYPREWLDVVRAAGMRSALSVALALALPDAVRDRQAIIAATFAVALATIISSGITVPRAVARVSKRIIRSEAGAHRPGGLA